MSRPSFSLRRMIPIVLAILLLASPESRAQGRRGIPRTGLTRGVAWAKTPLGIAGQVFAAVLLLLVVIKAIGWLNPGISRRRGRRSLQKDLERGYPEIPPREACEE